MAKILQTGFSVLSLICCLTATAQERGYWRAASTTARSITGDIGLSDDKLSINFANFTIARVRNLDATEVGSVFASESDITGTGGLYRLEVPAARKFLNKNTLCGSDDTHWMVTYVSGKSLHVALFSSQKPPVFTPEALNNSSDLCGTFSYVK